jgi:uncharacterized membrane protein YjjP (DUF1212 family)
MMIEFAAIPLDYYLLSQFFFLSFFFRVTGSFSVYQLLFFLEKIIHPLLIDWLIIIIIKMDNCNSNAREK